MSGTIQSTLDGSIGWLTFDHPQRRNAITLDMWRAIPAAIAELDGDPSVRVIVIRGAGTHAFISGADISEFEQSRIGAAADDYQATNDAAFAAIQNCATPTIAMIHGPCLGGGLAIALCADLRYCDDRARFTIPAAKLGVGYGAAGINQLQSLVGPAVTKEILFTAELFDSAHALRWGLVNDVVESAALEERVRSVAARIAANAPLTQRAVKLVINGAPSDIVDAAVQACTDSADYREGIRAFLGKRQPEFTGD